MTDVVVLGGGIVGVATALALQARGRHVTIVDRGDPTDRSSFGNAGIIQVEAVEPYAMPRSMADFLAIARRRSNAVNWHWSALPGHLLPLWKYFRQSAPSKHAEISHIYARLTSRATKDHAALIDAAEAWSLIRCDGFRHAYRDPAALSGAVARAERLACEFGVRSSVLGPAEFSQAEPNLRVSLAGAIHWRDSWTCRDPGGLIEAYARFFKGKGGRILTGDAMTLAPHGEGWAVSTESQPGCVRAREVVICLGVESAPLCKRFGLRIPLFRKRGYHRHYATSAGPDLVFVDTHNATVLAPMASGLRILTGAEIALRPAPATPVQLDRAVAVARELFDIGGPKELAPWVGNRPCMPDMLPVVGPVPAQVGLWANFGHGHQGFTLGPTTAEILADEMTGAGVSMPALSPGRRM